jgi:hypothetical protein
VDQAFQRVVPTSQDEGLHFHVGRRVIPMNGSHNSAEKVTQGTIFSGVER